jgi:type 1 glutamine amidotransferase
MEAGDTYTGILYEERARGILATRGQKTVIGTDHKPKVVGSVGDPKELQKQIKKEDWNEYHITARGNHLVQAINGHVTVDVTDEDKSAARASGILALQLHAGPPMKVQFRNLRLKRTKLEDKKKVAFIAGPPSHGYGAHEHKAGSMLLAKSLNEANVGVLATVYTGGWPKDPTALDNVDCIVIYCDGGGGHIVNAHLKEVAAKMSQGVGLVCIHYAVEVTKGEVGDYFLGWIGGYFEMFWSVNPHWTADFKKLPEHPITRGVKPFSINDEWYYHMRFRKSEEEVTPILTAIPPDSTRGKEGTKSSHGGNPDVFARKGLPEHVAWAHERSDGGRGFGFTGGHVHWNWANPSFRKLMLNAITWCAKAEVPQGGVPIKPLKLEDLEANQDEPQPKDFNREAMREQIKKWSE